MLDFRPPLDSPVLLWFMDTIFPLYCKVKLHDTRIKVVDGALERFKTLDGHRAMLCPNHSNVNDPEVMYGFGREAGEHFNYIAAREVFDYDHGSNGWWIQRMGTYSVVRGAADRESFKMTRKILSQGPKKLVLFPEGEISRQNDTLMALESGAAQMGLWALQDVAKQYGEEKVISRERTIFILPMAFKYFYPEDITSTLGNTLTNMENRLGIKSKPHSLVVRMRQVAATLLDALEKEYGHRQGETLNERMMSLRRFILENLARVLRVDLDQSQRELEWVRVLRNKLDDFVFEDEAIASDYQKDVHQHQEQKLKLYYHDLNRVVNFISIYDSYVSEHMTQERLAEVIDRLETEIMGHATSKGPREVLVEAGEAIDLSRYYLEYKKDKKRVVQIVTDQIFGQISGMLQKLEKMRQPRFIPD